MIKFNQTRQLPQVYPVDLIYGASIKICFVAESRLFPAYVIDFDTSYYLISEGLLLRLLLSIFYTEFGFGRSKFNLCNSIRVHPY